jgi:geranylgeranyl diphosphate synthase type II
MHAARFDFERYMAGRKRLVERKLAELLLPDDERHPAVTVRKAMRYAALGSGKRLRGIVTLAACAACGGPEAEAGCWAAAMELIHAYSLVHDDLPAMDDDDLRRGRPTTHRVFGEAVAILAGDALLTRAFELLATYPEGARHAARRNAALVVVSRSCGADGLIGGQIADLEAERSVAVDATRLEWIHRRKTGALFAACAELGAICAGAGEAERNSLARFGETLGLAFQIADDLLDRSATAQRLGKTPGKDLRDDKATYPALHGAAASRQRAEGLIHEARAALRESDLLSPPLDRLAGLFVTRSR